MAKFIVTKEEIVKKLFTNNELGWSGKRLPDTLELEGDLVEEERQCSNPLCQRHNPQPSESQILNGNEMPKVQDEGKIEEIPLSFTGYSQVFRIVINKVNELCRAVNKLNAK